MTTETEGLLAQLLKGQKVEGFELAGRTEHDKFSHAFRLGRECADAKRVWFHESRRYGFVVAPIRRGQILRHPSPNVRVIFEPSWGDTTISEVEWGCKHEMETVEKRNCYYEGRCTKCGYHYGVDSGD